MFDRATAVDEQFLRCLQDGTLPDVAKTHEPILAPEQLVDVFDTQIMSRHLDFMSRRSKGKTFYSIGSSGHEGMAALALASRLTDMAFLHYRDAAFVIQRRKAIAGSTPLYDMCLSFAAAAEDPVSGGRHKVLGGLDIFTPPQTSTIASHLPKAVGAAHSLGISRKLQHAEAVLPEDAVILCSFGDASANHSTAQGAINAAAWAAYQHAPMPLVFICEDNNIGISVRTPTGWIEANFSNRPGLTYMSCDGTDIDSAAAATSRAVDYARNRRRPVFLHMKMTRLMGHAGADIEASYTDVAHIEAREALDPLLKTARHLLDRQILGTEDILKRYEDMRDRVHRTTQQVFQRPRLDSAEKVMASLVPAKQQKAATSLSAEKRETVLRKEARARKQPLNLAKSINAALTDLMLDYDNILVFGEDVARKGGVYGVTTGLQQKFGPARVMDTLLDEQTILGTAIGSAHNGFIPIPEIQFLAYLHNAEDQVRGEAATLSFFSDGQYTNPMVIRIAGLGYQKGFGGHFHNDNSFTVLRDIPGIIVACPSSAADAPAMLRECVRLAHEERRVVVFLEPIALYMTQDLYEDGDGLWLADYTSLQETAAIPLGQVGVHGDGKDLCILTYGNGTYLSRKAAKELEERHGLAIRIVDLRWLQPLDEKAILDAIAPAENLLIVDECRETGSLSEQLVTLLLKKRSTGRLGRVAAKDSFIPLGPAAYEVLPSVDDISRAAERLCLKGSKRKKTS